MQAAQALGIFSLLIKPVSSAIEWYPLGEISVSFSIVPKNSRGKKSFDNLTISSAAGGALALGAVAIGALAIGAFAIGRLVIGSARIRKSRIDSLRIGSLEVDTLRVRKLEVLDKQIP
jgi:hypothetical protein